MPFSYGKRWNIVLKHTFGKSFKFSEKDTTDILIVFKYYKNILRRPILPIESLRCKNLIIGGPQSTKGNRISYLNFFNSPGSYDFIGSETMKAFHSYGDKLGYIISSIWVLPFVFIGSVFAKNRSSFALLMEYPLFLKSLLKVLKGNKGVPLFYFYIFELETNLIAYYFMKKGVKITKIASEVPISLWNRHILASDLVLCNAFQKEEVKLYQETIEVENILSWGAEHSHKYLDFYKNLDEEPPSNSLGFYSTASWVRKMEGHIDQGVDMEEGELQTLRAIKNVVDRKKEVDLVIFLHPKEKNEKYLKLTSDRYDKILGKGKYKFGEINKPSSHCFHMVDLAVAFNTTLMYERLYCGYKSLLMPMNPNMPVEGTSLEKICAKSPEELEEFIISALKETRVEFFKSRGIDHYSPLM